MLFRSGDPEEVAGEEARPAGEARPSAAPAANPVPIAAKPPRGRREGGAGGGGAVAAPANQVPEGAAGVAAAGGDPVGEDDYQAYYLSAASEEGPDRGVPENNHEEEPDIFAGIKPLEQEGRMEVRSHRGGRWPSTHSSL